MYKCELYTLSKDLDSVNLLREKSGVQAALAEENAELLDIRELSASRGKIAAEVSRKLDLGAADLFIFANALSSTDHSSFRKRFYDLVTMLQNSVKCDDKALSVKVKVSSLGDLGNGYKGYCFRLKDKRFLALPQASLTGKDNEALITEALAKSEDIFAHKSEKYPDGVSLVDKKGNAVDPAGHELIIKEKADHKKKQGFIRSFIPWKGDSKSQIIRKSVVLVAIIAFVGALAYVLDFFIFGPMQNNAITSEIQSIAYSKSGESGEGGEKGSAQDWKALKKINKEIVGWLKIPDTVIDYPVLEHIGDDRYNQYYIDKSYKKDGTEYGSIFLDYRSTDSVNSRNVIMHGHNMRDGSQFHSLLSYSHEGDLKGDLDYYRKHPVIIFNTPEGDAKYKIISVFKTSTRYEHGEFFNYMQGAFNSDAEFMNFVYNLRIRSMFDIPVTCNEGDQIITLSTCCYEFYEWRCVVVARKVRPGEDESVDVNLASLNPSPLFPDVYYERYGGERPDPLTFKTANSKSAISWYDGKGDLEGSEDLTATLAANPTEPPTEKPKPGETRPTEPPEITYYQVVYRNVDGSQYAAYNVREGDPLPTPPGTPTMAEDDNFTYVFDGWNLDIPGVDFQHLNVGLEIYPTFNAIPK